MNLLVGKILQSISYILRNEEHYPKKRNLKIEEIDNHFFVKHRTRFLFFTHWEYICYNDTASEDIPVAFNTFEETTKFIDEISCD